MNLSLIPLAIEATLLAYFKILPAGVFLILTWVAIAYLGAYYIKIDGSNESTYARDKALNFAFVLTSHRTIRATVEFSSNGKLKARMYHILIVPVLLGSFSAERFLGLKNMSLTRFIHHAAATSFCLYLALKEATLVWPNGLLLMTLFAWLTIQPFIGKEGIYDR